VRTTIDELGTILTSAATQPNPAPIPDGYWNYVRHEAHCYIAC
jgi:hypothetical protein